MPIPMTSAQITADIEQKIRTGVYRSGDQLPSYAQLAEQYRVSITPIARAIRALRESGALVGVPGRGVFVAE